MVNNIIKKNLKLGDVNDHVAYLQHILKNLGMGFHLVLNGNELFQKRFGETTELAVKEFQIKKQLENTGIVDDKTATILTHIYENDASGKYFPTGEIRDEKNNDASGLIVEAWITLEQEGDQLVKTAITDKYGTFKTFLTEREAHDIRLHEGRGLFFRIFDDHRLVYDSAQQGLFWKFNTQRALEIQVDLRKEVVTLADLREEDRLTRLCLIGSGIVCGLDVCVDHNYNVKVSSGNGITSIGKYIESPRTKTFQYAVPFETDDYPLFKDAGTGGSREIWKLLESPEEGEGTFSIHPQSEEEKRKPFLQNKVLFLYQEESIDEDGKTSKIHHFLLMKQQDAEKAIKINQLIPRILWSTMEDDDDFIYNDDYNPNDTRPRIQTLNLASNPAYRLPELYLRRLGFGSGDPFNCPPEGADASVFPSIASLEDLFNAYIPLIDDATKALDGALNQLFDTFGNLLDCKNIEEIKAWIELLCLKWETFKLEQKNETADPITNERIIPDKRYYIQYFYGWVRDLMQGYNELRQDIIDLIHECCPDPNEFPSHLFLGLVMRTDLARQPKPFRHTFRQPPIYNGNADRLQRIRLYFWRELMMVKTFYLPDYISNSKINPYANVEDIEEKPDFSRLKFTPSRFYDMPLGEQSIPFYYPVNWSKYSVHHFWNYQRTKTSSTDQLLSYHAFDIEGESYTVVPNALRPLHYRLDRYPFFRIEGHIGMESSEVEKWLIYWKQKYSLPINFLAIEINPSITQTYTSTTPMYSETYNSFKSDLLGMEHLAGVKEYGTFIIITQNQKVVADFAIHCCANANPFVNGEIGILGLKNDITNKKSTLDSKTLEEEATPISPSKPKQVNLLEELAPQLLSVVGQADPKSKEDLKKVNGIGPQYENRLNSLGIYTLGQVSKMTETEYAILDKLFPMSMGRAAREDWAGQAKKLIKNKKNPV